MKIYIPVKILLLPLLLPFLSCNNPVIRKARPLDNVIVIIGDDHAITAAGCYGNEIIRTPNIDYLARRGILFENAYSNAPVCSASRQSILTGKYPHATGVTLLKTPFRDDINLTVPEHLWEPGAHLRTRPASG